MAVLAVLLGTAPLNAQTLPIAGDEQHLWVVQPGEAKEPATEPTDEEASPGESEAANADEGQPPPLVVRHRAPEDEPNVLRRAGVLREAVQPLRLASHGATLWIVEADGTVTRLAASRPAGGIGPWQYEQRREPSLPTGTGGRAFDAGRAGQFALLRVTDAATLAQLDKPARDDGGEARPSDAWDDRQRLLLNLPPRSQSDSGADTQDKAEEEAEDQAEGETNADTEASPAAEALSVDRLVRRRGAAWQKVELPTDWPGGEAHILAMDSGDAALHLLAREPGDEHALRVYTRRDETSQDETSQGETWQRTDYALEHPTPITALSMGGQLVVAQPRGQDNATSPQAQAQAAVQLTVLRRGRSLTIGELTLPVETNVREWGVTGLNTAAALVAETSQPVANNWDVTVNALWWARMNLQGETLGEPAQLQAPDGPSLEHIADYTILVAVLVLAVLLMLLFWRRDAQGYQLELPEGVTLAGLMRRAAAGALDLAPALAVAMFVYRIGLQELMMFRWPGQGQAHAWHDLAPGMLAIGVFVAHTLVAELIFARSLGKWMMGLRVHTIKGERPSAGQILVRNLLKSFDLVAWLLLLLPMLGPYRQRLGDLVARTVVTMPTPSEQDNDE